MKHTEHYQLNQWEANDKVQRTDFNADNAKLDAALHRLAQEKAERGKVEELQAALAQLPRMTSGHYVGTGGNGAASPNTLTFPFPPRLVIITTDREDTCEQGTVLVAGQTSSSGIGASSSSGAALKLLVSWSGNSVSWYTKSQYPSNQLNSANTTYFYFALG